jgi:hypothetical protein
MKLRAVIVLALAGAAACSPAAEDAMAEAGDSKFLSQPLVSDIYTADPSARVWDGKIYIYPSHDIDAGIPDDDLGSQYAMNDYRVLSMDSIGGPVTVGPVALAIADVPWAGKQMWAPDAARKNGTYYLYFPVKDKQGVFHIGVASGTSPTGPFTADPQPIPDSFSMDPNVFEDTDGQHYMYFGGIWGGQLQQWATGTHNPAIGDSDLKQDDQPALSPQVARMADDMRSSAATTTGASSKARGCISAATRTTSRTRPATRTSSPTRPATTPTGRSPSAGISCCRCRAGPRTTRSSTSAARLGCSTTTTS